MLEVRRSIRGPQIFVSRTHKGFLRRLFELEVPEIHGGTVEIKAIAREAGSRSKVAVGSRQDGLDPVGATVGQRGARVQAVVAELAGEKIDVIPWSDDAGVFVANALSPAQVLSVDIDEEHRIATVTVPERMLSLAIGREGQNARLAARLTGWRIDIRSDVSVAEAKAAAETPAPPRPTPWSHRRSRWRPRRRPRPRPSRSASPRRPRPTAAATADTATEPAEATAPAEVEAPAKPKRATKKAAAEATEPAEAAERRRRPRPRRSGPPRRPPPRPPPRRRPRPTAEGPDQGEAGHQEGRRRGHRGGGVVGAAASPASSGAAKARHVPMRTCVACRTERTKRDLTRIVRTPDRQVVLDPGGRLAGRGAYVCPDGECLQRAIKKGALARALEIPLPAAFLASVGGEVSTMNMTQGGARGQE